MPGWHIDPQVLTDVVMLESVLSHCPSIMLRAGYALIWNKHKITSTSSHHTPPNNGNYKSCGAFSQEKGC